MSAFAWTQEVEELSPAALTVLAQAVDPTDNGRLMWDAFFPRRNVDSVDLENVEALDFRPASDFREWNQRGRLIPSKTPSRRKVSIVPVEGNYLWGEYELQKLNEMTGGNASLIADQMQTKVPDKVRQIAMANLRRIEIAAFTAWALGTITQRNPQNAAETVVASFAFDSARYQTASTAWNDAGVNAYDEFLAWLDDSISKVGGIQGAVMRRNVMKEILADSPDLAGGAKMTFVQLEQRIQDDLGSPFRFYPMENTVEQFTDGGTATAEVKIWTAQRVAIVPTGGRIGATAFAPVVRAMEIARQSGNAGIDTNGQTAYYEEHNNGRELSVEVQVNPLPIPEEGKVDVIDVGF